MKLLYGTANPAKLQHMQKMLQCLPIEIIGLDEINVKTGNIDESGNNPLENAKIKATAYYKAYKKPVFSCDSGLFLEGVLEQLQPGVHVRRVGGKVLNDDEMLDYYMNLAAQNGDQIKASYKNAICFIVNDETIFEYDGEDLSEDFIITSKPHLRRVKGFPLDSISIEPKTGKYYLDLDTNQEGYDQKITKGFQSFFRRTTGVHYRDCENLLTLPLKDERNDIIANR